MLGLHECSAAVVERKSMGRVDLQRMIERVYGLVVAAESGKSNALVIKSIDIIGIDVQGIAECIDSVLEPLELEKRDAFVIK